MFWYKRALAAVIVSWVALPACAFTFSYGSLFEVKEVKNKDGALQLPLTRKKYKNVKVLSKELYEFLRKCPADCVYPVQAVALQMEEFRPAASRNGMFVADVSFNEEVLLTFLVFQNKKGVSVKFPEAAVFKDKEFKERVRKYIADWTAEKI